VIARRAMTLIEVLIAIAIAGVVLFPVARFLYRSSWNHAGMDRFAAERQLDSLVRSVARCPAPGDSIRLESDDSKGRFLIQGHRSSNGAFLVDGSWTNPNGGPGRELWLERFP
jgi:prepilin-type N-terminal cleavage/methylation domain-containing protein